MQHAAQDSLFAHQIGLHFGNKGALQHAGTMTAGCGSPCLGDRHAIALWIVFRMHGDQRRDTETTFVFFTHFSTRTFRRDHDHGDIGANLLAYLNDIKAM